MDFVPELACTAEKKVTFAESMNTPSSFCLYHFADGSGPIPFGAQAHIIFP